MHRPVLTRRVLGVGRYSRRPFASAARFVLNRLGSRRIERLIARICDAHVRSLSPEEALRFLFRLDDRIYGLQNKSSLAYGGGVHTKHRHTRYHDFFATRVRSEERVLDIGCGDGHVAYEIAEQARAWVVGIDNDPAKIAFAHERMSHPRVEYFVGDVFQLDEDLTFDVLILSNILEHLTERVSLLRNLHRSTGASRALIRVPLFERDWRVPLKKEVGVEWRLDTTHETEYTLESFAQEMADAGLTIKHQEVRWGEIWAEASSQ